jgi:hypothetical protein
VRTESTSQIEGVYGSKSLGSLPLSMYLCSPVQDLVLHSGPDIAAVHKVVLCYNPPDSNAPHTGLVAPSSSNANVAKATESRLFWPPSEAQLFPLANQQHNHDHPQHQQITHPKQGKNQLTVLDIICKRASAICTDCLCSSLRRKKPLLRSPSLAPPTHHQAPRSTSSDHRAH